MVEVGPTTITQDRLKPGGRTFTLAAGARRGRAGAHRASATRWAAPSGRVILAGYLVAFAYWLGIAIAALHLERHLPRLRGAVDDRLPPGLRVDGRGDAHLRRALPAHRARDAGAVPLGAPARTR